jgi:hypothetical protein
MALAIFACQSPSSFNVSGFGPRLAYYFVFVAIRALYHTRQRLKSCRREGRLIHGLTISGAAMPSPVIVAPGSA